jgi:hypothetical protein
VQLVSQLRAGELSPAGQCLHDCGHGVLDRGLVESMGVAQLLAGNPPHPRTGQVE